MYQLIRSQKVSTVLVEEGPAAIGALFVAELFYKFHSFTLECVAFVGTWYAFSWALGRISRRRR